METRTRQDGTTRRRYECANGQRFTTEEKALEKK
jgi:transcriptional regulator NrdR family protein